MLKHARETALKFSSTIGLTPAVRDGRWRNGRLLILAYHGISLADEHEWNPGLYIQPSVFRDRLASLRDGGYEVLPLSDAVRLLRENRLPRRSVVITFDDGFHDFHRHALPILREFGFPATVYLSTYYCEYNRPVFDIACSYVLWKARGIVADGAGIAPNGGLLDLRTEESRAAVLSAVRGLAERDRFSGAAKDDLLSCLAERVGVSYDELRESRLLHLMTPEEVSALPSQSIAVELHTHRHRTPVDESAFRREIEDNRRSIQAMTGLAPPTHFCYPSGVHKPEFARWLAASGVASATTCEFGLASSRSNPFLLPRLLDATSLTPIQFEGWLAGVASFLPRRPTSYA